MPFNWRWNRPDKVEMISREGVKDKLPKYWSGQLAIYYCNYCEEAPIVGEGEVVVSVGHDACVAKAGKQLLEFGRSLVADTKAALMLAQVENRVMRRDLGLDD